MKLLFFLLITFTLFAKESHPMVAVKEWCKEEKALTEGRYLILGTLASVSPNGMPHTRMIEVSHFDRNKGALFFTHKNTRKAKDFEINPQASLNIWLPKIRRQVTLEGAVKEVSRVEAEKSWNRMSRFRKLSFLASNHMGELESEESPQKRKDLLDKELLKEIPMPDTFVGYRLVPEEIIFYQMNHRSLPTKEIAILEGNDWVISLFESCS